MTKEQKESLIRARAHFGHLDYMGLEMSRVRTEDIKTILSIIDSQETTLTNLKSDLEDLKGFMIDSGTWERFEGSMVQSLIKVLEEDDNGN